MANLACNRFRMGYFALASALFIFISPTATRAVTETNGSDVSQRDYELKVKEYELAERDYLLKANGERVTVGGAILTIIALIFGYFQYRKADGWKRAEFLAKEMKEFYNDPPVQNALMMIDWSPRRINLLGSTEGDRHEYTKVTRAMQVSALQPHVFLALDGGSDAEMEEGVDAGQAITAALATRKAFFSKEEARIRDSYDRLLDHFERFASYLESGLIAKEEIDPYLRYWIVDIATFTQNPDDAAWTCALLAYIEFYGFKGVQQLFGYYGYTISTKGVLFEKQSKMMQDSAWAVKLKDACQTAAQQSNFT